MTNKLKNTLAILFWIAIMSLMIYLDYGIVAAFAQVMLVLTLLQILETGKL